MIGEPKAAKESCIDLAEGGGDAGNVCDGIRSSYFFGLDSMRSAHTFLNPARYRDGVIILEGDALDLRTVAEKLAATPAAAGFDTPVGRPLDADLDDVTLRWVEEALFPFAAIRDF